MVWASGFQVSERMESDLLETVGVLGMAGKDIQVPQEHVTAGGPEASHHA